MEEISSTTPAGNAISDVPEGATEISGDGLSNIGKQTTESLPGARIGGDVPAPNVAGGVRFEAPDANGQIPLNSKGKPKKKRGRPPKNAAQQVISGVDAGGTPPAPIDLTQQQQGGPIGDDAASRAGAENVAGVVVNYFDLATARSKTWGFKTNADVDEKKFVQEAIADICHETGVVAMTPQAKILTAVGGYLLIRLAEIPLVQKIIQRFTAPIMAKIDNATSQPAQPIAPSEEVASVATNGRYPVSLNPDFIHPSKVDAH